MSTTINVKIAPLPRGAWSNSATYAKLDVVSYNGSSYMAIKATPAGTLPTNTTYWQVLAEQPTIADGSITTNKIADGAVTSAKIADGAVGEDQIDSDVYNSILNAYPNDIASGDIASFPDGADMPVKSALVNVEPYQNLNGYDNPWVGGAGKNKFDNSALTSTGNTGVTVNATGFVLKVLTAGTYKSTSLRIDGDFAGKTIYFSATVVNSGNNNGVVSLRPYDSNGAEIGGHRLEYGAPNSGTVKSAIMPTGTAYLYAVCYSTFNNSGQVNDTATFTDVMLSFENASYAPYSNICPIYPANGKNLLPTNATDGTTTLNGITLKEANGVYSLSGTASAQTTFNISLSASVDLSPSTNKICFLNSASYSAISVGFARSGTRIHYWSISPSNRVISGWTDTGNEVIDGVIIVIASGTAISGTLTISPMLIPLSIDSYTYVPYKGLEVTRTGKNLSDKSTAKTSGMGGLSLTQNGKYGTCIQVNETYTISFDVLITNASSCQVRYNNVTKKSWSTGELVAGTRASYTYTPTEEGYFNFWSDNSAFTASSVCFENIQIEKGSIATSYEPYQSTRYFTDCTSAGDVYGGTLDVTTGVLAVLYAKYNITSFVGTFGATTNGYAYYAVVNGTTHVTTDIAPECMKSNIFTYTKNGRPTAPLWSYGGDNGGATTQTFILPSTITTLTDANTWLASHPVECVFRLATPQTYQLTPTQVRTLLGVNNIWTDSGTVEVNYLADTSLYIQKLTGSTEEDMIANANIASGKYFMVGNRLFYSTSAIAQGANIVVGTNCTETNLAEALNTLNS